MLEDSHSEDPGGLLQRSGSRQHMEDRLALEEDR